MISIAAMIFLAIGVGAICWTFGEQRGYQRALRDLKDAGVLDFDSIEADTMPAPFQAPIENQQNTLLH